MKLFYKFVQLSLCLVFALAFLQLTAGKVHAVANGDPCTAHLECTSRYCTTDTHVCAVPDQQQGSPCTDTTNSSDCAVGLSCTGTANNASEKRCLNGTEPSCGTNLLPCCTTGPQCDADSAPFTHDFQCSCKASLRDGKACSAGIQCASGYCLHGTCTAASGQPSSPCDDTTVCATGFECKGTPKTCQSMCTSPEVRMCEVGGNCDCIEGDSCGDAGQIACSSLVLLSMQWRYYCKPGLTAIFPTGAKDNEDPYCVHNQEEADAIKNGGAFSQNPAFNLCKQAGNPEGCTACATSGGVWSAIGCVPTTSKGITGVFLTLAISISGGIVLLRVLQAAFMLSTSQGEQNKVQEARDILTSSIAGLLFILFSMVLLNTIGVSILRIPGF